MVEIWKDCELGQTYKEKECPNMTEALEWLSKNERYYEGWHLRTVEVPEATVTLTKDLWNRLVTYLLVSTQFRKGEKEAWIKLARERNEDGAPAFENAAAQADFWSSMNADIETIRRRIDEALKEG